MGLVLTAAANVLVNPWRVLPESTEIKALDPYREIDAEIRTCKAGLAIRGPWDVLIIGSSRPNTGMDPAGPAFECRGRELAGVGLAGQEERVDDAARLDEERATSNTADTTDPTGESETSPEQIP